VHQVLSNAKQKYAYVVLISRLKKYTRDLIRVNSLTLSVSHADSPVETKITTANTAGTQGAGFYTKLGESFWISGITTNDRPNDYHSSRSVQCNLTLPRTIMPR
jgi:hypothetical protein